MTTEKDLNPDKVRAIIAHAINGLHPEDQDERIQWCRRHGVIGVIMRPSDVHGLVEFDWGGHPLAVVPFDVLRGDGPLEVHGEFVPDVPDTVPDDLLEGDDK